jgi:hypothetical protein
MNFEESSGEDRGHTAAISHKKSALIFASLSSNSLASAKDDHFGTKHKVQIRCPSFGCSYSEMVLTPKFLGAIIDR